MLDLSSYYNGPSFDYAAMYQQKRQDAIFGGLGQIFDIFGGIGSRLSASWAADDYAEQVRAARDAAYANAQKIAAASAESTIKVGQFNKTLMEQNAFVMETNAINLRTQAEAESGQGYNMVAAKRGEAKSAYATSGVATSSGSVQDVLANISEVGTREVKSKYSERINQINNALSESNKLRLEGAFSLWSAEEQAKFIKVNAQQRLY